MSRDEDLGSVCFNLSGVKYDNENDLAMLAPVTESSETASTPPIATTSFLNVIGFDDEAYVYDGYYAFVKDLPNEILVSIFAQLCFKDLCMVEKGL
jgi:hypothetical protein